MCFVALLLGKYSECEGMKVFHVFIKHPKNKSADSDQSSWGRNFFNFLNFFLSFNFFKLTNMTNNDHRKSKKMEKKITS